MEWNGGIWNFKQKRQRSRTCSTNPRNPWDPACRFPLPTSLRSQKHFCPCSAAPNTVRVLLISCAHHLGGNKVHTRVYKNISNTIPVPVNPQRTGNRDRFHELRHHTDTHIYILSLALALLIHNKQQQSIKLLSLWSKIDRGTGVHLAQDIDGSPIISKSDTHPSLFITFTSFTLINLVFIFWCSSSSCNPVHVRHVDSSSSVFSLSSHRSSFLRLFFNSHFLDS